MRLDELMAVTQLGVLELRRIRTMLKLGRYVQAMPDPDLIDEMEIAIKQAHVTCQDARGTPSGGREPAPRAARKSRAAAPRVQDREVTVRAHLAGKIPAGHYQIELNNDEAMLVLSALVQLGWKASRELAERIAEQTAEQER